MFPGVRQMIPTFDVSNFAATSALHRAPFPMSSDDKNGFAALITIGNHSFNASATAKLRAPDQLMKISMAAHYPKQTSQITTKDLSVFIGVDLWRDRRSLLVFDFAKS